MTSVKGIITVNIKNTIAPGLAVYDNAGSKVGEISDVNRETGYFTVALAPFSDMQRPFAQENLSIPFVLITNIDPRELYLSVSRDELQQQFADPPARTIVVEGAAGSEVAVTSEPSGYDKTPIEVERVPIWTLRDRIGTGDHVWTSDGVDLGTIKQYDSLTGWMLVEKGLPPNKHDVMVPLSVAADVDGTAHEVRLVTSRADLERTQHPTHILRPVRAVGHQCDRSSGQQQVGGNTSTGSDGGRPCRVPSWRLSGGISGCADRRDRPCRRHVGT